MMRMAVVVVVVECCWHVATAMLRYDDADVGVDFGVDDNDNAEMANYLQNFAEWWWLKRIEERVVAGEVRSARSVGRFAAATT